MIKAALSTQPQAKLHKTPPGLSSTLILLPFMRDTIIDAL